jgi:hypothetical protein
LQSALIKKTADGEYYVKEGLFSKLVVFPVLKQGKASSHEKYEEFWVSVFTKGYWQTALMMMMIIIIITITII